MEECKNTKVPNSSLLSLNVFTCDVSIPVRYSLQTKTPYCNDESLLGVDIHMYKKLKIACVWLLFFL